MLGAGQFQLKTNRQTSQFWARELEKLRLWSNASFLNWGFEAPSSHHQSLFYPFKFLPIDSDQKGRQIWTVDTDISLHANIHMPTQTDRYRCEQIYRHKCIGKPGTDILTGWLEVRRRPDGPWHWEVSATLCLARETGFVFFWKSDLSRWKTRFVTTRTRGLVLDDQWISGCSGEKYRCWRF